MSTPTLQAAYNAAVEKFGQEVADKAAVISIEAWGVSALAGASEEECEAEQLAAFALSLEASA